LEEWIRLAWHPKISVRRAMFEAMFRARQDVEIFRSVVFFVAINVVNLFIVPQTTTNLLFRDKPMLVGVAAHVGEMVIGPNENQDIAVRCN